MSVTTPGERSDDGGAVAVLVLAAGAGTRMRSSIPKVLHRIGGRTLLSHALHAAAGVSPDHLVAVVGHDRERVAAACAELTDDLGRTVTTAVQEVPNGTGGAVAAGMTALPDDFDGTVLVTAGDVPLLTAQALADLRAEHRTAGAHVTLMTSTAVDPTGYGRVLRTQDGEVTQIVEESDATPQQKRITEVNSGVYAFDARTLAQALTELGTHNAQGELYLTDVVALARSKGRVVRAAHIDDAALVAGCNDRLQLSELGAELNRRILHDLMRSGVTVVDPATTWVDIDVRVDVDATLLPGTQLHGRTVVGEHAVVGPDTTLTDVTVGEGAQVIRTHGSEAVIGDDASVGPFAYLRPGSVLGAGGKIGTFVETKNSTIGAGTKVPHLTYVGDATIGEQSNIGASSVFVNYDGVEKNRTVIGSHCRTGSDTMFIAPLTVGDGAYTGAGTVLRRDVPPGALAVSSGDQRIIEGWVEQRRPGTAAADAARRARQAGAQDEQKADEQ
ncbi:bifunctional UDP-N-acetylglucosamine diphosphorylase/glucosamine-1-phosphate N-acetyltransferase GlmU [Williamsia serinedens]|uniref:Bifunctional protein GlmU n=1 Tax=Williamsia serinedens TaxID=391736 RepID=A0ABT1H1Q5_9NOCA|nr:bifunctional UDP-N-acetylglucosamine diphosphorylase/glucosamine-1-phosphate N-acetyltransferase GlmU [Williamsia serinedens]MCP2160503.1 bifunctional UDP-N-acetylglucosamine pyrophosphorylase / Glucosamine-1-phosphate N-acetyltransferase [Williamsia serinedens]